MLHPAHRNVFARLACNSRAVTGSAFFTLPSLPKLPFGPVPQIVSYSDVRVVPYHSTIVVEAVCDVHRYKEFLPWVEDSRVISMIPRRILPTDSSKNAEKTRTGSTSNTDADCDVRLCELCVGFGPFTERYVSRVSVVHAPDGSTLVKATAGDSSVFSLLENEWVIQPSSRPGSSLVKFSVAFRFKSPAYAAVAEALFTDLSRRMASAFEQRFAVLHKSKSTS